MSKKYLIDENSLVDIKNLTATLLLDRVTKIEFLDDEDMDEIGFEFEEQHSVFNLSEYLKSNNLQIIKIIE